ncbi:hypothetical protein NHQ30_001526 [Ciborinia camelliae]|nr:hypothetical protein NHQ30_001526 [Ciborinia camelliae]
MKITIEQQWMCDELLSMAEGDEGLFCIRQQKGGMMRGGQCDVLGRRETRSYGNKAAEAGERHSRSVAGMAKTRSRAVAERRVWRHREAQQRQMQEVTVWQIEEEEDSTITKDRDELFSRVVGN